MPHMFHRAARAAEGILLASLAAAIAGLMLVFFDAVRSSFGLGFLLLFAIIVLSNVFWWVWCLRLLLTMRTGLPGAARFALAALWTGHFLFMLLPFAFFILRARSAWDSMPVPVLTWTLSWHLLIAGFGGLAAGLFVVRAVARGARWTRRRFYGATPRLGPGHQHAVASATNTTPAPADSDGENAQRLSRRALLVAATAAAPVVITAGAVGISLRREGQFRLREITLKLPRLPERLRGMTITHLSDMHVGRFFRPEHLPRVIDAVNRLQSDMLMVTGDLIDHSADYMPDVVEALSHMESRYGRCVVVGNHDLFDQPRQVIDMLVRREPHFLLDEHVTIRVGGEPVQIAGLFWARHDRGDYEDPGHVERAAVALEKADMENFTIGLAHHPHAFDAFAARGVDLTLAGHTHGGQIMLTPSDGPMPLGAGTVLFRYIHGEYAIDDSRMYVSSGVGNWFPLRVNAPAELVRIRLI